MDDLIIIELQQSMIWRDSNLGLGEKLPATDTSGGPFPNRPWEALCSGFGVDECFRRGFGEEEEWGGKSPSGTARKTGSRVCIQGTTCWLGLEAGTWDDKMTQVVIKSFLTWLFVWFLCWLTFIFFNSQSVFLLREGGSMVSETSARLPPESLPL